MQPLRENYCGIYSLMLTPYFSDRSIDYKTYEAYAEWQAQQGVQHLFAVCGSSEMSNLSLEERLELARLTVKHKGETTVVATANMEYGLEAQIEEVKRMSDTGVDGLVFTTMGMGDRGDELVEHISKLAAHTDLPLFMYEFPGRQPHLISGETYGKLVRECGILGIKDTTCTLEGIGAKIDNKGDSCVIQANMPYLYEAFRLGSRGVMATPTSCGGAFFAHGFHRSADHRAVFSLEIPERRKGVLCRKLFGIASIDARHERVYRVVEDVFAEAVLRKARHAGVVVWDSFYERLAQKPELSERREQGGCQQR